MPGVILRNVVKSFGETDVIHGVDVDVQECEFRSHYRCGYCRFVFQVSD